MGRRRTCSEAAPACGPRSATCTPIRSRIDGPATIRRIIGYVFKFTAAPRTDDGARHLRRQRTERAVRFARQGSGAHPRRRRHAAGRGATGRPAIPAPGSEIAQGHGDRPPPRRGAGLARPHRRASDRRSSTGAFRSAAPQPSFTVVREDRGAAAGRADARRDDIRGHRRASTCRRLSRLRPQRPCRSDRCSRSTRGSSPTRAPAMPSGPPAASAARSTAFRSRTRTTSTCWACRRPAARGRSSITCRGSIRAWRRRCAPPARSSSARRTSTNFRSAISASARSPGPSGTPTIRRSARRVRAAAARSRSRRASSRSAFGTDTCNSLSNPAAFASLATIRTTRGLTSRAGVMPLNPYNDAVGPMAKSVREVALVARSGRRHRPRRRGRRRRPTATSADRLPPMLDAGARSKARASACFGSGSSASPASAKSRR